MNEKDENWETVIFPWNEGDQIPKRKRIKAEDHAEPWYRGYHHYILACSAKNTSNVLRRYIVHGSVVKNSADKTLHSKYYVIQCHSKGHHHNVSTFKCTMFQPLNIKNMFGLYDVWWKLVVFRNNRWFCKNQLIKLAKMSWIEYANSTFAIDERKKNIMN